MTNRCTAKNCKLNILIGSDKCVLHVDNGSLNSDPLNSIKIDFDGSLVAYIINSLKGLGNTENLSQTEKSTLESFLLGDLSPLAQRKETKTISIIKGKTIVLDSIVFPSDSSGGVFKYKNILEKLDRIHFNYCIFFGNKLALNRVETFYENCTFFSWWDVRNTELLANENSVLFQDCEFQEDVSISKQSPLEFSLFNNCKFLKRLELSDQNFNFQPFNNTGGSELTCSKLKIENCTFSAKFLFNHTKLDEVIIKDSVFEEKFAFKKNSVDKFEIDNSNFKKLFDAYKTKFINFRSFKSIYDDFVGFEKCQFGISEKNSQEKGCSVSSFTYTTFMSFTNFRSTKFNSGLDLQNTNLKEPPNFLNSELDPEFTNRETFRVIKDSFDQIGNHIEANRFFVDEMRKYREELKLKKGCSQEKFIFHLNYFVSNFGSSYVKPIMWIVLTLIVFHLLVIGHEKNLLYKVLPTYNQEIAAATGYLNSIASYALPFKQFLLPGMELISLVFYIIIISLVWQAVNALKRHTKR